MGTLTAHRSIFEMDTREIRDLLTPVAKKAKQDALDNGSWYAYKNDLRVEPDMFIHEFKDGRKELIKLGNQTGEYTVLKVFKHEVMRQPLKTQSNYQLK